MTRSSLPIFLSSVPYTAVPSTLSLAIKEMVSFDSRVVAVVIEVSFHRVGLGTPAPKSNASGIKCGAWIEFRRTHRNPISSGQRRFRRLIHTFERYVGTAPCVPQDRPVGQAGRPSPKMGSASL